MHGEDNTSISATVASSSSSSTLNLAAPGRQQTALCATAYRKQQLQKQLFDNVEHTNKRRSMYSLGFDSNNSTYSTTAVKSTFKNQRNSLPHTNTLTLPFSTSTTLTTASSTFNQQQDSDCGSSSGLGGTNNCSSDSSLLDSDSRDSGGGSGSVVNGIGLHKMLDATSTLTPASIMAAAGMPLLPSLPLSISNMPPPLQTVINARPIPPLSVIPPLPPHLNTNALHLLSSASFVGPSVSTPYTCAKPLNGVIATTALPLNNTNGKQWPSTSIPPPTLSHPSVASTVKPLYTMTCEAAAIAAAAAAAAGYHVR